MKIKKNSMIIFCIILLTGCASVAYMRASIQIESAQKYLLSEDYEKAIIRLNKAISIDPKNIDTYILLSDTYQKLGDIDKADKTLSKAKKVNGISREDLDKLNEKKSEIDSFVKVSEPSGEYSKPLTISLSNKNNYEIHYTIENESNDILISDTKYIAPITIKRNGIYLLKSYSIDDNGKEYDETTAKYKIRIDKTGNDYSFIQISSKDDFAQIRSSLDGNFELTNDIDLGDWEPIGTEQKPFTGRFLGNGHVIKFKINKNISESYNASLFGVVNGGEISDLIVKTNISLQIGGNGTLMANSAGICGKLSNGTIEKCFVQGEILTLGTDSAYARSGGITASAENSSVISNCMVDANIQASSNDYNTMAAGIATWLDDSTVDKCIVRGSIYGNNDISYTYVSGIAASGDNGKVNSSVVATTDIVGNGLNVFLDNISNFAICKYNLSLKYGNNNNQVTYDELKNEVTYINIGWDFVNDWQLDSNSYPSLIY